MSALKGFLRAGKPNAADLAGSLYDVLTGISGCTVDGRDEELAHFRESMAALANRVNEKAPVREIESVVVAAVDLLRDHNTRTLRNHDSHTTELKAILRTMTETLTFLSESRSRSVHQLQFMERELEQATQIDDIRLLRSRITKCLEVVRDETVRLQHESERRSKEVRRQIDEVKTMEPPARFGSMDAVTGLPSRRVAESVINDILRTGGDQAVCVFVVKQLSAINARYGRAVGDEVMLYVANHFAQHLSSATALYRWSGPALLCLSQLNNDAAAIKRSWMKAATGKQEVNLRLQERSIFVLVETAMLFQVVGKGMPADELFVKLDKFVSERSFDDPRTG